MTEIATKYYKIAQEVTDTPILLMDPEVIAGNYRQFRDGFGDHIYYAIKANNSPEVLAVLAALGSKFDVASKNEITRALTAGVKPEQLLFTNPVGSSQDVKYAKQQGVDIFVADAPETIRKLALYAPNSRVLIRVNTGGRFSQAPMTGRFGTDPEMVVSLLSQAQQEGLVPLGLTTHVGSQTLDLRAWTIAMEVLLSAWQQAIEANIPLVTLDLGGGFPVNYESHVPTVADIVATVQSFLPRFVGRKSLFVEPGRAMVASAGVMVSQVIARRSMGKSIRMTLDVGSFQGLLGGFVDGHRYPIMPVQQSLNCSEKRIYIEGPSCDGADTGFCIDPAQESVFGWDLDVGDRVMILNTGAYTTSMRDYNGLNFASVQLMKGSHG